MVQFNCTLFIIFHNQKNAIAFLKEIEIKFLDFMIVYLHNKTPVSGKVKDIGN